MQEAAQSPEETIRSLERATRVSPLLLFPHYRLLQDQILRELPYLFCSVCEVKGEAAEEIAKLKEKINALNTDLKEKKEKGDEGEHLLRASAETAQAILAEWTGQAKLLGEIAQKGEQEVRELFKGLRQKGDQEEEKKEEKKEEREGKEGMVEKALQRVEHTKFLKYSVENVKTLFIGAQNTLARLRPSFSESQRVVKQRLMETVERVVEEVFTERQKEQRIAEVKRITQLEALSASLLKKIETLSMRKEELEPHEMMQEAEYTFAAKAQLQELEGGKEQEGGDKGEGRTAIELQATDELIHSQLKKAVERLIVLRGKRQPREHEEMLLLPQQKKNECVVYNLLIHQKSEQRLSLELPSYFAFLNLKDCLLVAGGQDLRIQKNVDLFLQIRYNEREVTHLPPLLRAKRRMGICVEGEEERDVFIIGGHDGDSQITAVDVFERKTQKWQKARDLNVKRHGPACVGVEGGRYILAIGGYNVNSDALSTLERYDRQNPAATWEMIRNVLPKERYMSACVWGEDRTLLVFGGMNNLTTYLLRYNEQLTAFQNEKLPHELRHFSYGDIRVCGVKKYGKEVFATDDAGSLRVLQPKGWLTL